MATNETNNKMAAAIKPTKCALRYDPPTLVLFYTDQSTGKNRRRSMPLRDLRRNTNVSEYVLSLISHPRHKKYIASIKKQQLDSLIERVCKAQPTETVDVPGNKTLDESLISQLQAELPKLSLFSSKNIQSLKKPVASASSLNKSIDDELDRILNGDLLESDDELDEKNQDFVIKPVPTSTPVKQAAIIQPVTTSRQATGITSVVTSTTVSKTGTVSSQASAKPATTAKQATNVVSKPATTSNQATVPTTASGIKTTAQTSSKTITSTSQPLTLSPVKPVSRQSLPPLVANTKAPNAVFPSALESVQPLTSTQSGATQQQSLPPPPPDEYSLKEEPLSELDEDLSISSDDDNDTPLMNSDQLKAALDNMKIVSSDDEDYNKMPEDEYKKRKAEMDKKFDQMRSKPTDSNFIYDKEEDYGKPTMESGWDVDSSSSSSIF